MRAKPARKEIKSAKWAKEKEQLLLLV